MAKSALLRFKNSVVYPKTITSNIADVNNGKTVDKILNEINYKLDNISDLFEYEIATVTETVNYLNS